MNFECLISYHQDAELDIYSILFDTLNDVLSNNDNEFDVEDVERMIFLHIRRIGNEVTEEGGRTFNHMLLNFTLRLPDETNNIQEVIDEFISVLSDIPLITHVLKFEDPLLQIELSRRSEEIFNLEMKLRRVLSIIYIHAYQENDPFDLLCEETVQPIAKEKPKADQMKTAAENQFFHLTFNQYINLNQRPEIKYAALIQCIKNINNYEAFRDEIQRMPIEYEEDAALIAGLKERMDAVESMRNCIAHNRRPSRRVNENYENARPLLDRLLDEYLALWPYNE